MMKYKLDSWKVGLVVTFLISLLVFTGFGILSITILDPKTEQFNLNRTEKSVYRSNKIYDVETFGNTVYIMEEDTDGILSVSKLTTESSVDWTYILNVEHDLQDLEGRYIVSDLIRATKDGIWLSITKESHQFSAENFAYDLIFLDSESGELSVQYHIDDNIINFENSSGISFELGRIEPIINTDLYIFINFYRFNSTTGESLQSHSCFILHVSDIIRNSSGSSILNITDFEVSNLFDVYTNNLTPVLVIRMHNADQGRQFYKLTLDGTSYVTEQLDTKEYSSIFITNQGIVIYDIKTEVQGVRPDSIDVVNIDTGKSDQVELDNYGTLRVYDNYHYGIIALGRYSLTNPNSPNQWEYFLFTIDQSDGFDAYVTNITRDQRSHGEIRDLYVSSETLVLEIEDKILIYRDARIGQLSYIVRNGLAFSLSISLLAIPIIQWKIRKSQQSMPSMQDNLQYPANDLSNS